MTSATADAIVVGGGIIGSAIALALGERGAQVVVLDAADGSRPPASAAAAGILGAQLEVLEDGPLPRLCIESRARFPAFAKGVEAASGTNVELRACGATVVAYDAAALDGMAASVAWQKDAGLRVERLDAAAVARFEPALGPVAGGYHFPDDARVEPRALLAATRRAAEHSGARFVPAIATRVLHDGARATGVRAGDATFEAKLVVVSAGSWSALLDGGGLAEGDVRPARGQMLELRAAPGLLRGAVIGPDAYLSPRDDGRLLVGSTVEFAGFDAEPTAGAARDLLSGAVRLAPALAEAKLVRAWAGLRPHTSDELPMIGRTAYDGLVVATGHFRNGVLLAPITAEIVAALAEGRPPPVDLAPFSPQRFSRLA